MSTAGGSTPATLLDPSGPVAAQPLRVRGAEVRAGACSWADRSLVNQGSFYPRRTMTATERLAWYCQKLPLAEITATYRFPPTPEQAALWAQRTPDGFTFDVRAWSLLTANPTFPDSLWADLHPHVRPANRERRRLYGHHLPDDVLEECWARFAHALRPLESAGRLGTVILRYPSWFSPRPETREELAAAPARLDGYRVAVELRSPKWFEASACEDTLELLEGLGLGLVCVDGPGESSDDVPPLVAATSDVAVVRFLGRRRVPGEPWTWPYRYSDVELGEWVGRIDDLASSAPEVHLLMDNCWQADAVDGASTLLRLLARDR